MPRNSKKKPLTKRQQVLAKVSKPFAPLTTRTKDFMSRRPHRSFKVTRRRDYKRSLKLPGYFSFNRTVTKTLLQYRKTFILLGVIYAILTTALVGVGSQDTYSTLSSDLQSAGSEIFKGSFGQIGKAALIFGSIGLSGFAAAPSDVQQLYIILLGLLIWLTTVWLLRNLLAGYKVKLRDGLYNAGAPIIATFLVFLVMVLQLIPVGIAIVGYSAADSTGLLDGGVETMLFWIAALLLGVMSLYWITSTFFALIMVTLPGVYPGKALKTAGDMLVGRRLRVLLRIVWMFVSIVVAGAVVVIPIILITNGLTMLWPVINSVPVIPFVLMLYGVVAAIWATSYVYLLYRRIVDDDAKPA